MKRLSVIVMGSASPVSSAAATYEYEGRWGRRGAGNGAFTEVPGAAAPNGNVCVSGASNNCTRFYGDAQLDFPADTSELVPASNGKNSIPPRR